MKWKTIEIKKIFSSGLFQLSSHRCELPDGRIMPKYYVMDFPDWVNIIPVTAQGEIVLIKQYRHASGEVHLEVPGGSLDPRIIESIEQGARREMLEETGYDSDQIDKVASHYPNPALQSNQMHTFIAFNAIETQKQNLDEFEELSLYVCSLEKLEEHLCNGDIDHSLMIASVARALPIIKKHFLETKP